MLSKLAILFFLPNNLIKKNKIWITSKGSIPELGSFVPSISSKIVLLSYSKTKKILPLSLKTSIKLTIWSCFSYFKILISLNAVFLTYFQNLYYLYLLTYSLSSLSLNFLIATYIPVSKCHAMNTIPYVLNFYNDFIRVTLLRSALLVRIFP